jgi:hypothetical protein
MKSVTGFTVHEPIGIVIGNISAINSLKLTDWNGIVMRLTTVLAEPVLVRVGSGARGTLRRYPCASSFRAAMRTRPYFEESSLSLPGDVVAERARMKDRAVREHAPREAVMMAAATQLYAALVPEAKGKDHLVVVDEGVTWFKNPSAGIRAWRLAAMLDRRCQVVPWPKDRHGKALLLQRMRERRVPHVEMPMCLLVARTWVSEPEVTMALAEVRGSAEVRRRTQRRIKDSKKRKRRERGDK